MRRKFIPVQEAFEEWENDPAFTVAYDALASEFTIAAALIGARGAAEMTQDEVAKAMGTTQAAIARLESGRAMPSTRTLERYAKATGTRLRISFEQSVRRADVGFGREGTAIDPPVHNPAGSRVRKQRVT